jgi:hypothetical protein
MFASDRLSRERVSLAALDDDEILHDMDDRTKVRAFARALRSGAAVPPLFAIRLRGELMLIHGSEQAAAAERVGLSDFEAIVFHAANDAESDEIGAVGFALAEGGCDLVGGLRLMASRMQASA